MKKILLLVIFFIPGLIFSSYYATAMLEIKINKLDEEPIRFENSDYFTRKITFTVVKFISGDGHNPKHAQNFPGKTFTDKVFFRSESDAKQIKINTIIKIKFRYDSGLGFDPVTKKVKESKGHAWYTYWD